MTGSPWPYLLYSFQRVLLRLVPHQRLTLAVRRHKRGRFICHRRLHAKTSRLQLALQKGGTLLLVITQFCKLPNGLGNAGEVRGVLIHRSNDLLVRRGLTEKG